MSDAIQFSTSFNRANKKNHSERISPALCACHDYDYKAI